jgi:hypothetical protein
MLRFSCLSTKPRVIFDTVVTSRERKNSAKILLLHFYITQSKAPRAHLDTAHAQKLQFENNKRYELGRLALEACELYLHEFRLDKLRLTGPYLKPNHLEQTLEQIT